jgi:hypothetical protein
MLQSLCKEIKVTDIMGQSRNFRNASIIIIIIIIIYEERWLFQVINYYDLVFQALQLYFLCGSLLIFYTFHERKCA